MSKNGFEIVEMGQATVDPLVWGRSGNLFHLAVEHFPVELAVKMILGF